MRILILACLCSILLSACGGGGGGGSDAATPPATPASPLEAALKSGDSQALQDPQPLLEAALEEIDRLARQQQSRVMSLGSGALVYPLPQSSHYVLADYGSGVTVLRGSDSGHSLASVTDMNGQRAAGIGFLFYKQATGTQGMDDLGRALITWLAGGTLPEGVALAGIKDADLNHWLSATLPGTAVSDCGDADSVACLNDSQVLLISDQVGSDQQTALSTLVRQARERGLGVFYLHTRGWNSSTLGVSLLAELGMHLGAYPGNYWIEDTLNWPSTTAMLSAMHQQNPLRIALQHFRHNDFAIDWAACDSEAGGDCDQRADLKAALLDGAATLRDNLNGLDQAGKPLFDQPGRRLLKLLVLLGDLWRRDIRYPMDKDTAPQGDFMRALYADYSVQYLRPVQPAQPDLGSFSEAMAVVPATHREQVSRQVQGSHFTALGAYALPGQAVTVTRTDHSGAEVALRLNTQYSGSTRLWSEYSRPRFLSSPSMSLAPGQSLTVTSPYGGTLQLVYNSGAQATVQLTLSGVAHEPFLQYGTGMDQQAFTTALQTSPLSWAEIRTPFAEIHSRRDRLNQSINGSRYNGSSQDFLDDLFDYVLRDAYTLAGFQGQGISLPAAVAQRCTQLGWDCTDPAIHGLPKVLHINVDLFARCGAGCSGNPYDQSWALDPYGWGESHELGHNLQRALLKIHDGRSAEVSNNIFPLHKDWRLFLERDENRSDDRIRYQQVFNILKQGAAAADPYQVAYDAIWSDSSYAADNGLRMAFYAQLPQLWREITGDASQGWDIYTLLYLAERQFSHLDSSSWASHRALFGMGSFAEKPSLTGNDFMLIEASFLTGRDLRPLWDQWGVDYGAATSAQLDALSLPPQEKVIWVAPVTNDWTTIRKVAVTPTMSWPF
ncbi:hypothetical protein A11A3_07288 [Alcanivorax hongdengensis A-11-3]|uniref:Peptidase M60 domain-containing protein n=1 Tax=Alcanivorax hongdengensis A-11-3 TaxID=1177179 RepID=L0WDF4_9GAMM|nr:ImpA family metalloprotease [Alcanivorax hongdengensis]EKF74808.1 hypothetical protein A11A3_07288 [Alcanivorax hongdengensis A-11-3]